MDQDNELVIIKTSFVIKSSTNLHCKGKRTFKLLKNALHKQKKILFYRKKESVERNSGFLLL